MDWMTLALGLGLLALMGLGVAFGVAVSLGDVRGPRADDTDFDRAVRRAPCRCQSGRQP